MLAALIGHYVDFVVFMGVAEPCPTWFIEEVADRVFVNESRFTFWTPAPERGTDYYEKELIETYSIVVRKCSGETHVMSIDTFDSLYRVFTYNQNVHGGVAAFNDDIIEYVECIGGSLIDDYPEWFYEYFTESLNNPKDNESYLYSIGGLGQITIKERCVVLRNRFGLIRTMSYPDFLRYYDPIVHDRTTYTSLDEIHDLTMNAANMDWMHDLPF